MPLLTYLVHRDRLATPLLPTALAIGALISLAASATSQDRQPFLLPLRTPPTVGSAEKEVYFVDVDNDGRDELITLYGFGFNTIYLRDDDGDAGFTPQRRVLGTTLSDNLAQGDIDGDGDIDFVSAWGERLINRNGTFTYDRQRLAGAVGGHAALGDFDGDSILDLYIANWPAHALFRGDGLGGFTPSTGGLPPIPHVGDLNVTDFNGDGLDDIVAPGPGALLGPPPQIYVFLGQRAGGLLDASPPQTFAQPVYDVIPADLDGDGNTDLLARYRTSLSAWMQRGNGTLVEAPIQSLGQGVAAAAVTDLDGDRDPDIVVSTATIGQPSRAVVLRNNGRGALSAEHQPGVPQADALAIRISDVDQDGDPDVLFTTYQGLRRILNDGTGQLADAPGPMGSNHVDAIVAADFDGDQTPDLVLAESGPGGALRLVRNRGDGSFAPQPSNLPSLNAQRPVDLLLMDLEGDRDQDLVVLGETQNVRLLRNDGAGSFTDVSHQLSNAAVLPTCGVVGDLDGDGDQDLVVGTGVYFNNGQGALTLSLSALPQTFAPTCAAAADFDGDGDLDLFFGTRDSFSGPQPGRLLSNDGTGQFTTTSGRFGSSPPQGVQHALFADLDGDGALDLVTTDVTRTQIFWNDTSRFTGGSPLSNAARFASTGDINGDGITDLQVGAHFFYGSSSRSLALAALFPSQTTVERSMAIDLDLDGDEDVVGFLRGQRPVIYTNTHRQLARTTQPFQGFEFTLEIYGPRNGFALVAASLQRTLPTPTAGLGNLWLDPLQTTTLTVEPLDASGYGSWSINLPNLPGAATVYAQAAVLYGPSGHLTNHEVLELR